MGDLRRSRPSWLAPEARALRPGPWLLAAGLVGVLLVEVWQSSRVAELSLDLDRSRSALARAQARFEYVQATLDRRTTRAELAPLAAELQLVPAEARQVVALPAAYLAADESDLRGRDTAPLLAAAEGILHALVPEATARGRGVR